MVVSGYIWGGVYPGIMKIYDYNGKSNLAGDRIRQLRLAKRLTQSDLAAKLQVNGIEISREALSKIESGLRFITDYELKYFAEVLDTTMDWLTEEDNK